MPSALARSSGQTRTALLLAVSFVLGITAAVAGIDDNLVGIVLGLCSASAFVVAFVHTWDRSRQFLRLVYASVIAMVGFVIVSNLIEATWAEGTMLSSVDRVLNALAVIVMLLIPASLLVGIVGALITWRRGSRSHADASSV